LYHAKMKTAPRRRTPPIAPPATAPTLMDEPEAEGDGVADVGTTVAAAVFGEVAVAVGEGVGVGDVLGSKVIAFVGTCILLSEPVSWDNILIVPS